MLRDHDCRECRATVATTLAAMVSSVWGGFPLRGTPKTRHSRLTVPSHSGDRCQARQSTRHRGGCESSFEIDLGKLVRGEGIRSSRPVPGGINRVSGKNSGGDSRLDQGDRSREMA